MRFALVIAVSSILSQSNPAQDRVADYTTPQKTYETYLHAILANDQKGAIACHHLVGDRAAEVLETFVGIWVVSHELYEAARQKFGDKGVAILQEWNGTIFRSDCSKTAVERTLMRVRVGTSKIDGGAALLTVKWADDEPLEKAVFHFSGSIPLAAFRNVDGQWKIDLHAQTGLERPADCFEKGTWGSIFHEAVQMQRAVLSEIRSGKLRNEEQTIGAFEARLAKLNDEHNPGWRELEVRAKKAANVKAPSATHLPIAKTTVSSTHLPIVAVSDSGTIYANWVSFGDDKAPSDMPLLPKSLEFGDQTKNQSCAPGIHVCRDGRWSEPGRLLIGSHDASPVFAWCEGENLHLLVCDSTKSVTHHVVYDPRIKAWTAKAKLPHHLSSSYDAFRAIGKTVHAAYSENGDIWYLKYDGEHWSKPLRLESGGRVVSGGRMVHLAVTDRGVAHVAWWALIERAPDEKSLEVHRRAIVREGKVEYHELRFDDAPIDGAAFDIGIDREDRLMIAYQPRFVEKHPDGTKVHVRRLVDESWTVAVKIDGEGERLSGDFVIVGNKKRTLITWSQRESYPLPGGGVLGNTFRRLSVDDGKEWSRPRWVSRHPKLRGNGTPVSIIWAGVCLDNAGRVHMVWDCCSYCMVEDLNRP